MTDKQPVIQKKKTHPQTGFRMQTHLLLLTFPKCEIPLETMMQRIEDLFQRELELAIVSSEQHQDGSLHRHCLIKLHMKKDMRGPKWMKFLDSIAEKHGNYQAVRNPLEALQYVIKEGNYLTSPKHLTIEEIEKTIGVKNTQSKSDQVAGLIQSGTKLIELNTQFPGFFLMNLTKIQNYMNWIQNQEAQALEQKQPFPLPQSLENQTLNQIQILTFLMNKVIALQRRMQEKIEYIIPAIENGLFITGPTGIGKSHFVNELSRYFRIYFLPMDEDFYDLYDDNLYDIIVLDEFKHQKKIQFLNTLIDGMPLSLRKKGGQILKKVPIPVIILTNYTLSECFPKVFTGNPNIFQTISRRLIQVNYFNFEDEKLDFYFYKKYDK